MSASVRFPAVDVGASGGRVMECRWNENQSLQEILPFWGMEWI